MGRNTTEPVRPRVCAVSFLNTVPLVWGMIHGQQRGLFDLEFALPAECADELSDGRADIGIVPVAELLRQDLRIFRGAGIACRGRVRSILLVSKVPLSAVRTLATDASSRTSVLLARVILANQHGSEPALVSLPPDLPAMLEAADAALVIGDPALRLDPDALRSEGLVVRDLGEDWTALTGLPMVFAVWAGRSEVWTAEREQAFVESARFGIARLDEIVATEYESRGFSPELTKEYLTENVVLELGAGEYAGMERFLAMAREIGPHEFETVGAATRE